ncbi:MAG: phage portal protein [Alphaproteobacteria bacterium]
MTDKIEPTALDRVVGFFSPKAGLERMQARAAYTAMQSGYQSSQRRMPSSDILSNYVPAGGSADADTLPDLPDLRSKARDLRRNSGLAGGAVTTIAQGTVGVGLTAQARPDRAFLGLTDQQAEDWQRGTEREWRMFCAECDITGDQHFHDLTGLIETAVLESGDCYVIRRYVDGFGPYATKLQVIEADRVRNPRGLRETDRVAAGVRLDRNGRAVRIFVDPHHPGDLFYLRGARRAEPRGVSIRDRSGELQVLHQWNKLRPGQRRGVPILAPVIALIKNLADYSDAEVTAAVVASLFTVFVQTETPEDASNLLSPAKPTLRQSGDNNPYALGKGRVNRLAPGEEVTTPMPGRPNRAFQEFVKAITREIGVALNLPYEVLIKHFDASYSASRAALEMAWEHYRIRRATRIRQFCNPVYSWFMDEAVATGRVRAPGYFNDPAIRAAWLGVEWIGPSRISLDPLKEAKADELNIAMGVETRSSVTAKRTGSDWQDNIEQQGRERRAAETAGVPLHSLSHPPAVSDPAEPTDPDEDEDDD